MSALDAIRDWPVATAAAAIVGPDGVRAAHGDTERSFELASVSKPLTARAVAVAVEEGALDLDDPAGPDGSTVRHLLAHASGLAVDSAALRAEPGTRRVYSNHGFAVLAAAIEAATGIAFEGYLDEAVFRPLGMATSRLDGGAEAAGYGCSAPVDDLARFAVELLRPQLVSTASHTAAVTVQFPGLDGVLPGYGMQRPNDWGLGLEIRDSKEPHWTGATNSPRTFGHFGQSGTLLWVDPQADLALVVLTDEPFGEWAKQRWPELSDAVLAEHGSD